MKKTTRRDFIKDASMLGLASLAAPMFLGGCEEVMDSIRERPVRRCIQDNDLVNAQLEIYKAAVSAMKALPNSDPRNWTRQAEIHQNFCPHGNWFFFPWHRVYLYYFEQICQQLTGETSFGLPFWSWCIEPRLPAQFWGAGNPLNNSTRVCTPTSVASPSDVGLGLVDGYLNQPNFGVFAGGNANSLRPGGSRQYGQIEGTPHNYIHGTFVRGDMATFMSPLDPIFWSHHCMVDVCWYEWNVLRNHQNTNDTTWTNFNYSGMFVDGSGNPAQMTTAVSVLLPLLNYRYASDFSCQPIADNQAIVDNDEAAFESVKSVVSKGAPIKLNVKERLTLADTAMTFSTEGKTVAAKLSPISRAISSDSERVLMKLNGVQEPDDASAFLRVFINKADASPKTSTSDPHYAGSFYFFRHSRNAAPETVNFQVDITETLQRLKSLGELSGDDDVAVSLVAVSTDQESNAQIELPVKAIEVNVVEVATEMLNMN